MPKIFVSYRRKDSADTVGRICDRLTDVLGDDNVFKDVDSIAPGSEYAAVIDKQLDQCDAILVVIGELWLTVRTPEGSLRLNDPDDMVRTEIEKALSKKMLVIPVLVGSASMPTEKQLPRSIKDLIKRNALAVRPDPDFKRDINLLIQALKKKVTRWHQEPKNDGFTRLLCPKCRKRLKLSPTQGGKRIRCPHCSALLMADKDCSVLYDPPAPKPAQPSPATRVSNKQAELETPRAPKQKKRKVGVFLWMMFFGLLLCGGAAAAVWFLSLKSEVYTITGTINISFRSRTMKAGETAMDTYDVNLDVLDSKKKVNYNGKIIRNVVKPKKDDDSKKDEDSKTESVEFKLIVQETPLNLLGRPNNEGRTISGRITGTAPVKDGLYDFANVTWSPSVGTPLPFGGKVQGKQGEDDAKEKGLKFLNGGQKVEYTIEKSDPMEFRSLVLPGQPGVRPVTVSGNLVFNYGNDSYYTDDLRFAYADKTDDIQGTVFWKKIEGQYPEEDTKAKFVKGAKSQYDFTLVYNAKADSGSPAAGSAQKLKAGEPPVFAADASMATLKGTIDYEDDGPMRENAKRKTMELYPTRSVVTFNLKANRLDADQVHNFLKMWLLMSGPVNDE